MSDHTAAIGLTGIEVVDRNSVGIYQGGIEFAVGKECGGIVVLINNHRLLRLDGHLIRADGNARSRHVCHQLLEVSQFTDAHLLVCNERHLLREYLLIVSTCLAIDTL